MPKPQACHIVTYKESRYTLLRFQLHWMLIKFLRSVSTLALLLFLGCQIHDIVIDISEKADGLEFAFHYDDNTEKSVDLVTIQIMELTTGRLIWQMSTL